MNKEKQIFFMRRKIDDLEKQLIQTQNENDVLTKENDSLKRVNEAKQQSIDFLRTEIKNMYKSYASRFKEMSEAKEAYIDARTSALLLKKRYQAEMERHLKRLRNQK